jgi:hypothetical protein
MYKKYKVAVPGKDVIVIDDNNYTEIMSLYEEGKKVHLIKFAFENDDTETHLKIKNVVSVYDNTNRFIVDRYVRMYNSILKDIPGKKYYVQNGNSKRFVSFFRKNNKIVFSFPSLSGDLVDFFLDNDVFKDLLLNVEVIIMEQYQFDEMKWCLKNWDGNVIIHDKKYVI